MSKNKYPLYAKLVILNDINNPNLDPGYLLSPLTIWYIP